jgi:integrase
MARVKDLWFSEVPEKGLDGKNVLDPHGRVKKTRLKTAKHPDRGGNKEAKRWLAVWIDPDGNEKSKAFAKQRDAQKYADKMEADADRGDYVDPRAVKEKFGPLAEKHLRMRRKRDGTKPGEATRIRTLSVYRNHVEPTFGHRGVQAIKASEIAEWLQGDLSKMGGGTQECAFHIVAGTFDLAVDDKLRKDNPARAKSVKPPKPVRTEREAWTVERAWEVHDELPEPYRAVVDCGAGLGGRSAEVFALAEDDFDFESEKVMIRRQVRRVGRQVVFQLPKGNKERTVPLPRGTAAAVLAHMAKYPPAEVTLPWMDKEGKTAGQVTVRLIFAWRQTSALKRIAGQPLAFGNFAQDVWKPALSRLGIIPPPEKTEHRWLVYKVGDATGNGQHVLRHVYDTMLADGGVSLAGIMEFMGHSRDSAGITVGTYGHASEETFEAGRQAVDTRLYKLRLAMSSGTVTELRAAK